MASISRALAGALFAVLLLPATAGAASFGYGEWLGEFGGNPDDDGDVVEALLSPVPFPSLDLDAAGKWDNGTTTGNLDFEVTEFKDGSEPIGGTWTYNGFPAGEGPEGDAIDLFLAVKYANQFSVFYYPTVNPGDTGLFGSSPTLTGYPLSTNANGEPFAISNIRAYWPPSEPAVIPLPPAVLLLGTALAGLAGWRRLRLYRSDS